jgi:hypothetical protein
LAKLAASRIFQDKWLTELLGVYDEPPISLLDAVLSMNIKYLSQESAKVRYSMTSKMLKRTYVRDVFRFLQNNSRPRS